MNLRLEYLAFTDEKVVSAWKSMETPDMSPFLHYDYMHYVYKCTRLTKPYRPRVACVMDGDEIVMLLALMGSLDGRYWKLLGDIQGCDRTDALWKPSLSPEERLSLAEFFFAQMHKKIKLHRIEDGSPLLDAMPQNRVYRKNVEPYVRIDVPSDIEAHIASLSSSVRQNIRTAYNRMKRDGIEYRLEVYDAGNPMTDEVWKKIMDLYFARLFSKSKSDKVRRAFSRWKQKFIYYHIKHDTLSLRHLDNSFHAVLYNGDRMMAFMNGLKTHDGKMVSVPRLAIDQSYGFYSPGYVLTVETMRYIASHPVLQVLDLSRGDEKYKLDMGGKLYSGSDFDLRRA